jgi:hypothetical protein
MSLQGTVRIHAPTCDTPPLVTQAISDVECAV